MRTIAVLSGKGGTGKTSVTASLAAIEARSGTRLVIADADVDAANLPLLLDPEVTQQHEFIGGEIAVVDPEACEGSGRCEEHCRFAAITAGDGTAPARVDPTRCEGCAVCTVVCPAQAITMTPRVAGWWAHGETRFGPLVFARLGVGGENSGKLVTQVRRTADELARERWADLVLIDGPPGTGCPVIAAMTGVDLVVAVTEPTPSARSDLERLLRLTRHFHCPVGVVFNKADLNPELVRSTAGELAARGVAVLGDLPYDERVASCLGRGLCAAECEGPVAAALADVHRKLRDLLTSRERQRPVRLPLLGEADQANDRHREVS